MSLDNCAEGRGTEHGDEPDVYLWDLEVTVVRQVRAVAR